MVDGSLNVTPVGIIETEEFRYEITDTLGMTSRSTVFLHIDTDGDGIGNHQDIDDDNDGILDVEERTVASPTGGLSGNQYLNDRTAFEKSLKANGLSTVIDTMETLVLTPQLNRDWQASRVQGWSTVRYSATPLRHRL